MTDRTAVPERVTQRAKTARRGGGSGPQAVGDYVGQPAGEAAQAVRRGGLRPGLDRSFGCPAELTGLVVAQDPAAGSGLARNGMVTLYVAAPGGEPLDGDAELAPAASDASEGELRAPEPSDESLSTTPVPARPRRRKRGLAQRPLTAVEPPSAPTMPGESASERVPAQGAVEPLGEWPAEIDAPAGALEDEPTGELDEREVPHDDEFVVQVEDVLAGRSGPPRWRGAYPRRRAAMRGLRGQGRVRRWLGEHRTLAGAIGAALALWTLVGAISAVDGHHPRTPPASALAPSRAPTVSHPLPATKLPAAPKPAPRRTPARSLHPHTAQHGAPRAAQSRPAQHRTPRPVHPVAPAVRETVVSAATPAPAHSPAPQPSVAAPPRASAAPAPAPEQSAGGLFSP